MDYYTAKITKSKGASDAPLVVFCQINYCYDVATAASTVAFPQVCSVRYVALGG